MRVITERTVAAWTGHYGPDWRRGVVSDHLHLVVVEGGATVHTSASGRRTYVTHDGVTEPVLCSELVEVPTEDGPIEGRCGRYVVNGVTCEGHAWLIQREEEAA